ncbi:MAG: hypothetical protein KW804_00685 [Candidatus Doudnabacteria bacterium]|nr:hypothetical protein [Candidatus Doudnabacteria bacterium]
MNNIKESIQIQAKIARRRNALADKSGLTVDEIIAIEQHFEDIRNSNPVRFMSDSARQAESAFFEGNFLPLTAYLVRFTTSIGQSPMDAKAKVAYERILATLDKLKTHSEEK